MPVTFQIKLSDELFLRDPQQTKLGHKIIEHGIVLIDSHGFESFTFKKLAEQIGSTEASIYRYFVNKHYLFVYLVSWYWEWMRFRIEMQTMNIQDARERMKIAIQALVCGGQAESASEYVNLKILHRIVISESTKAYHVKEVDKENQAGFFFSYKELSRQLAEMIKAIQPEFPYPISLASNLLEMVTHHFYFALHLPSLTEVKVEDGDVKQLVELLHFFVFGALDHLPQDHPNFKRTSP